MSIEIDTIKVKTNSFLLEYKNGDKSICGGIDILNFPSETVNSTLKNKY